MADSGSRQPGGISRRKFVGFTAFGAVGALAGLALQTGIPGFSRRKKIVKADLPGPGSIFEPKNPPSA